MVLIPAGAFTMGNTVAADTDITDAAPVSTTVSAFYMDVNEVTLSQWQSVYYWATSNGYSLSTGGGKGPKYPVQGVSWYDCLKWCNARSEQAGKAPVYYTNDAQTTIYKTGKVDVTNTQAKWTANGYRLPTEAEWEKAARGGVSGQRFPWGNTINQNLANYTSNYPDITYDLGPNGFNANGSPSGTTPADSPVGSFASNGYGLNDMIGNVYEWCWDWYGTPYAGGTDPLGSETGTGRVFRGGAWSPNAQWLRTAKRRARPADSQYNDFGFRSVLSAAQP
jgi:formylglycine-generating enzyme required for sulfatase activity